MSQPLTMRKKAEVFEHDLFNRFNLEGQILCKLRNATPEAPFISYNMPDDAYMTGMMAAVFSFKYAVTKDPADKETVSLLLRGMHKLCHITGKKGLLARAWWPLDNPNFYAAEDRWHVNEDLNLRWNGDVSVDQMDGMFFGFYYAYKYAANEAEKAMIAADVCELLDTILENDYRILDQNGNMTTWGNYRVKDNIENDHLHGFLLLQHLKIAEFVTGDPKYTELYRKTAIDENMAAYSVTTWLPVPPHFSNHSDNVMHIMERLPLLEMEEEPALKALYLQGLRTFASGYNGEDIVLPNGNTPYEFMERLAAAHMTPEQLQLATLFVRDFWEKDKIYHGVRVMGTPIYNFVFQKYLNDNEEGVPVKAKDTLRYFPLDMKWNSDTIQKYEEKFGFTFDPTPQTPELPEEMPAPIDRRLKDWSAFVQNPYRARCDEGEKPDGVMEYNGHDYLFGYWLGRLYGFIGEDE